MRNEALIGSSDTKTIHTDRSTGGGKLGPAPPASIKRPDALGRLLCEYLPMAFSALAEQAKLQSTKHRVDGQIIGTGEADFTKGNTLYTLTYQDRVFQLIDVPGIEGDESKYADMVRQAVAKAHLVFYVNGTNKKPEKATAQKIRAYLRLGTKVCPIINVRGSADAYEFEEDRVSVDGHAGSALAQTAEVLEAALGEEALLPGCCVQGLLAFAALAMDAESDSTTIVLARERDLVVQQRNYLKRFGSAREMLKFSQLDSAANVLHNRIASFREDIVESNKLKVRSLLAETVQTLREALAEHQAFIKRIDPEFEKCRASLESALDSFERTVGTSRRNLWASFFNEISEESSGIVSDHYGDNDRIVRLVKASFEKRQAELANQIQEQFVEHLTDLQAAARKSTKRLVQDVQRTEFEQHLTFEENSHAVQYQSSELGLGLELKDYGWMLFNIGSYTAAGFAIGTSFPGVGNAIFAVAGAIVGFLVNLVNLFIGKRRRIRKVQEKVQGQIDAAREDTMRRLKEELAGLVEPIRAEMQNTTVRQVDQVYGLLVRPSSIIDKQITLMTDLINRLERMPHGTFQAVQR